MAKSARAPIFAILVSALSLAYRHTAAIHERSLPLCLIVVDCCCQVAKHAGEGFQCVASSAAPGHQLQTLPVKILPWLGWVKDQAHLFPKAVQGSLLLALIPREGSGTSNVS